MKHLYTTVALGVALLGLNSCSSTGSKVVVTPVAKVTHTATGQALRFPKGHAQMNASVYDIPTGAKLPMHKHPYPRFAYVMQGDIRVVLADGRQFDYHPGQFIPEVIDTWHYGQTVGRKAVRLLVLDAIPVGANNVVTCDGKH